MAIDIGDAVLSVLLDSSQATAQLGALGPEIEGALAPAQTSLGGLDQGFKKTSQSTKEFGTSLSDAFRAIPPVVQQTDSELQNMAFSLRGIAPIAEEVGERVTHSLRDAKGEAGLLGEAFGIHLPRHVRTFMAELPGVGTALSAAFAATAVIFIIEAAAQLIEKMIEMAEHGEKVAAAWKKVDDDADTALRHIGDEILKVEAHIAELNGNHMLALQKTLELLGHTSLAGLAKEIETIQKDVDAAFIETKAWWDYITTFGQGNAGLTSAKKDFDDITKNYQELLKSGDRLGAFAVLESGADKARIKTKELTQEQDNFKTALQATNDQAGSQQIKDQIVALQIQIDGRKQLTKALDDYRKLQEQTNKLEQDQKAVDRTEEQKKELGDLTAAAQASLKERLAAIQTEKNAQHQAFEDGKITAQQWAEAQNKATLDALQAQTNYDAKLIEFAKRESDGHKASVAATNASVDAIDKLNKAFEAAANGVDKARQETAKLHSEMDKLAFQPEKVHEQVQAFKELEAAEKKLADAEKTLAQARISDDSKEQIAAVQELARQRILSKEQEAAQLARIEREEEDRSLADLQQRLAQEEAVLNVAKTKFQEASKHALFPPTELAQLKAKLDEAQVVWDKTQTEILRRQSVNNSKLLALDRSYYGESVALAVAAGNRELALKLQSAKAELTEATARKENTKAIENQIKALEKQAHDLAIAGNNLQKFLTLLRQGGGLEQVFQQDINSMSKALQTFGAVSQFAFEEFGSAMQNAISQAILGEANLGQAMAKATADVLSQIAARALVWGMFYTAQGIADAFWNPARAAADFASAGEFFAIGAAAGAASFGINSAAGGNSKSGGTSSTGSASPSAGSPGLSAGSTPSPTVNVLHLATGGLVAQPTLAVVGDSGPEAAIPLRDRSALQAIANAITSQMHGGGQELHLHIKTDLPGFVKVLNHGTKSGKWRVHSSTSDRAIKKT